ncbi:bifunctional folylpolyglutamate synthase/dihydrofolate synthase [Bacillus marinisedimentorum]|uniref:bifunctional folylpolyglutamate synthase/dihydrofolate synthase n=1 Tax=Bacillus marinisedimentorum TaxID=1821260 RepID=UPI00087244E8|nr:folylpolyglutamate synthase/dihydrofolate synthase family protein [Bacillus marinisedimentorum]
MVNTYEEALDWLQSRHKFGIKPGLDRMEWMLEQFGHPERRLKTVHIAGTNGKGSVVAFLNSILTEAGYEVGTFTSPYIERFNERIACGGRQIPDDDIVRLVNDIRPVVEEAESAGPGAPTEFEVVTLMAILYFANAAYPDIVLFETGLGGRLDSTNVIHPLVSIITNISMDHANILGGTIPQIAAEKAGIIKNGVPVITAADHPEAVKVIEKKASEKNSKLYRYGIGFTTSNHTSMENAETFDYLSAFSNRKGLQTGLIGRHQISNAALALMAADFLKMFYSFIINDGHVETGLRNAFWPARFEKVADKPAIILDGAHNEAGIRSLVQTVHTKYAGKKVWILFAALTTKDLPAMTRMLEEGADRVIYTSFDFPNAAAAQTLYSIHPDNGRKEWNESWMDAINASTKLIAENDILIITGSLYFLSGVRSAFVL